MKEKKNTQKNNVTDFFRISCELSTWSACPTTSVGTCWRATLTERCMCGGTGETRSPTSSNTATTYVHDCTIVCWCWLKTGILIVLICWFGMTMNFYLHFPAVCLLVCCCLFVCLLLFIGFFLVFFWLFICLFVV